MKCYKTLFTKEGLSNNISSYILLSIIISFLSLTIIYNSYGFIYLEDDIRKIISLKEKEVKSDIEQNKIEKPKEKRKRKIKNLKNRKNIEIRQITPSSGSKSSSIIVYKKNDLDLTKNENIEYKNLNNLKKFKNDFEMNSLSYEEAIKSDKRNYYNYYISLLKTKHPIIFYFFDIKDYNSKFIKISLFLLYFSFMFLCNELFFHEFIIHKIYVEEGKYDFSYFIKYIICSFIISRILEIIMRLIFLTERNICEIKAESNESLNKKVKDVKNCINIKSIILFIIGFLFLLFIWYYLSSFAAVYRNTEIFVIKNTIICFGFSLLYPFWFNIIPGIFRIYSLMNKNRENIYNISKIIQHI